MGPARLWRVITSVCLAVARLAASADATAQLVHFSENFDSTGTLPPGWSSSRMKSAASDDMTISASAPHSAPNCVCASNGTVAQTLTSRAFDFTGCAGGELSWYMRRSATFSSGIFVDASLDGGSTIPLGDTLRSDQSASYLRYSLALPLGLRGACGVRFRWHVVPTASGTSGTIRFDDVELTAHPAEDLALERITFTPLQVRASDPVTVHALVKNTGSVPMSAGLLGVYRRGATAPVAEECLGVSSQCPVIAPADSLDAAIAITRLSVGENALCAVVEDSADEDSSNNRVDFDIDVAARPGDLVINEIMYEPIGRGPEYVEMLNSGAEAANLSGWSISSGRSAERKRLLFAGLPLVLLPGEAAVASEDSTIFRLYAELRGPLARRVIVPGKWTCHLNNGGDEIVLADETGSTVDSVAYSPAWHNPGLPDHIGRSLERIRSRGHSNDPLNWTTCVRVSGGTPAQANSVSITPGASEGTLVCTPNPFSPDGDGVDDVTVIHYRLPQGIYVIVTTVYDALGRLIRRLSSGSPAYASGDFLWDGRDERGVKARIGIYIVLIEAIDQTHRVSVCAKGVVVLAGRL